MSVDDFLDQGILHQEQGRFQEARTCYESALTLDPAHPDALHLLGLTYHAQGDYSRAVELITEAIRGDPDAAFYHHNLGEALAAQNLIAEAADAFAHAVRLDPASAPSSRRYIACLIEIQRFSDALAACKSALQLFPGDGQLLGNLGVCYRAENAMPEAAQAFRDAVQAAPENPSHRRNLALCLLALKDPSTADAARALARYSGNDATLLMTAASILVDTKHFKEAYDHAQAALKLNPELGQAHFLVGYCLFDFNMNAAARTALQTATALMPQNDKAFVLLGMAENRLLHKDEALLAFEQALKIDPTSIDANVNYGILQQGKGKNDLAFDCFKIALDLEPEHPQANLGMGIVLHRRCKITEGERLLRKSIERSPKSAEAYAALGHNLAEQGRIDEGLAAARHACELDPQLTYAHNNLLFFSLYDYRIAAEERSAIHRRWGQSIISPPPSSGKIRRTRHRRLRIGYVSADFRGHAVSFFIESVLELHDHSAFEIYCYSDVKETDLVTDRIKRRADHWISIAGKTDLEVATQIQLDEIDVLVDLVAHTADGRLGLFAQRQAPVQVSYIGYPWTTGLPAIGYRISDQYLDPPGPDDQLYVEKTVRVDGFWSYRPMDLCPPVSELPALKGEPFTFGSFNNVSKLNDLVLETWARILTRVPGSNLMLKYKGLDDPGIAERILGIFEKAGIDRDRIELFALTSLVEHMAQHNHVDLGLDPFPFNGGTTTFHSVYMGVPVITLEGRGHAERMGSAILSHVGLPEFITKSVDEYVDRAVQLANDLPKLAAIRTSLRQRLQQSALMDAPRHTRQLEAAFVQMYEEQTAEGAETGLSNGLPGASDPSQIEKTVHPSANGSIQFSVIICGRDAERREKSQAAFSTLLHDAGFEFIYAKNPYSLASGYNAAVQEATAELMIFCHDDIEILSPDAAVILQRYLSTCDIVGIAGTDHLIAGSWISSGPPHIFGQFAHRHPAGDRFALYVYGVFDSMPKIQALDGLFLAMRREVLKTIRFDETNFDGFHLYDIDFTFAAYLAGFKIAVALDLFVIHDSGGSYDLNWDFYRRRFIKKYSTHMLEFPTANPTLDQRYLPSREKLLAMMNGVASKSAPLFDNQIRPG